jgi:DNA-binding MarR family transcriptional regulator
MSRSSKNTRTHFSLEDFLPYKLSQVSRLTQELLESILLRSNVTVAQWRVYLCLATVGPSHLNGIVEFTRLPQSSLSRSIASMSEQGWVRSARNEGDRRISHIELTEFGAKFFSDLTDKLDTGCGDILLIPEDRRADFFQTLNSLIARLTEATEAGAVKRPTLL